MCDPLTITGAALSLGSVAANQSAQRSVQRARSDAQTAETRRQRGFALESEGLVDQSRGRYDATKTATATREQELADLFRGASNPETSPSAAAAQPAAGENVAVQQERDAQTAKTRGFLDQQAQSRARLRGVGDILGDTLVGQARDAGRVGTINSFAQGSSAVLPLELEAANQKGSGARLLGDLLKLAGTATMAYGLKGAAPATGAKAGGSVATVPGASAGSRAFTAAPTTSFMPY